MCFRSTSEPTPVRSQLVRDTVTGDVAPWNIFDRADLTPGACILGPAIVAEDETSTLIGPNWQGRIDSFGYIELTRVDT